jgi:hypothetical protein
MPMTALSTHAARDRCNPIKRNSVRCCSAGQPNRDPPRINFVQTTGGQLRSAGAYSFRPFFKICITTKVEKPRCRNSKLWTTCREFITKVPERCGIGVGIAFHCFEFIVKRLLDSCPLSGIKFAA